MNYFAPAILDALANGPLTFAAVSRDVVRLNITDAHDDFRLCFFALAS